MLEPLRRWRVELRRPVPLAGARSRDAAKREAWHKSRLERLIVELEFAASASRRSLRRARTASRSRVAGRARSGCRAIATWWARRACARRPGVPSAAASAAPLRARLRRRLRARWWCRPCSTRAAAQRLDLPRRPQPRGAEPRAASPRPSPARITRRRSASGSSTPTARATTSRASVLRVAPLPGSRGGHETMLCEGVTQRALRRHERLRRGGVPAPARRATGRSRSRRR